MTVFDVLYHEIGLWQSMHRDWETKMGVVVAKKKVKSKKASKKSAPARLKARKVPTGVYGSLQSLANFA